MEPAPAPQLEKQEEMEESAASQILRFLKHVNLEKFVFGIVEIRTPAEERWESPFTDTTKARCETVNELLNFLNMPYNSELRILSLKLVFEDNTYIYFDRLIARVKIFNTTERVSAPTLHKEGLLGSGKLVEEFQIVF